MKKILIVEDDRDLCEELAFLLKQNGFLPLTISDFSQTLEEMKACSADLILLDITLPQINGEKLLRDYRKVSQTPVIMVTSRNTEMDEVLCMTCGADDFIAKPYNPTILLLHIEAVFRRMDQAQGQILEYGDIRVDMGKACVTANGLTRDLSKNEMQILVFLLNRHGQIVSRDELISDLWDSEEFVDDNTLTVNITRIRKKLEECGVNNMIKTRRGLGYLIL